MVIDAATDTQLRIEEVDFMKKKKKNNYSWKPNILQGPSLLLHKSL